MIALSVALALLVAETPAPRPPARAGRAEAPARSAPRPAPAAVRSSPPPAPVAPSPALTGDEVRLLVEQKCSKCHSLSRALGSDLTAATWRAHLKRMAKWPGAAITDEQAERIHGWLRATRPGPAGR